MLRTAAVVPAAITMLAALAGSAGAAPSAPGRIVYVSIHNPERSICIMEIDGTPVGCRTVSGDALMEPGRISLSPDGRKIAFSADLDPATPGGRMTDPSIYVMDADGSHITRLAKGVDPAFSPDGRKIVFFTHPNPMDNFDFPKASLIYVMNADGSQVTPLTGPPGGDMSPTFSPDGRKIAFTKNFDPGPPQGSAYHPSIYVMDADGSHATRLATGVHPAFSPDGRKIVFPTSLITNNNQLYVMNADGSELKALTGPGEGGWRPTFSLDGRIVFTDYRGGNGVYMMDVDGSHVTRVADISGWVVAVIPCSVNPSFASATELPPARPLAQVLEEKLSLFGRGLSRELETELVPGDAPATAHAPTCS